MFKKLISKLGFVQQDVVDKMQSQIDALQKEVDKFKVEPDTRRYVREQLEPISRRIDDTNSKIRKQAKETSAQFNIRDKENNQEFFSIRQRMIAMERQINGMDDLPKLAKEISGRTDYFIKQQEKKTDDILTVVQENERKVDKFDSTYKAMLRSAHIGSDPIISQHW